MKDSTSGVDVVWGDDEIFHEIIVSEGESDGGVHKPGGISGEAAFMGNIGGHFAERNHDKVTDESDEAVPEEKTKGAASGGTKIRWNGADREGRRGLTGREPSRIQ